MDRDVWMHQMRERFEEEFTKALQAAASPLRQLAAQSPSEPGDQRASAGAQ